jgi:type I restriction enzyme S subunit
MKSLAMNADWYIGTLRDALGEKGYIRGPFGSALRRSELKSSGVPVYEQQHAITGTREFRFYIDEEKHGSLKRFTVQPDDLIISCSGTLGRVSMIRPDDPVGIISQALLILRPDKAVVWPKYLYYFMSSKRGYDSLLEVSTGSVQVNIAGRAIIEKTELPLPPLREQQAIACILGTLDDKIELNRRRNRTLEALARAIFQSWFVDFDPVRAKAAVRREHPRWSDEQVSRAACPKLNPELAALFPDRFEDSPLGEIPAGWRVGTVRELCVKVENGGTPKRQVEEYWTPAEVPWLTSGEVRQPFVVETENFISKSGLDSSSAKMWPPFTTVVALYGATAGIATMLGMELCANQACCGLVPKDYASCFIHQLLSGSLVSLQQQARGSAQQNLSQSIVADFPCLIPTPELLEAFENQVHCLYQRCIEGIQESRTLAALRDALLPKLISGELRVPDAERIVGRTL